jgi:hypothetical protein
VIEMLVGHDVQVERDAAQPRQDVLGDRSQGGVRSTLGPERVAEVEQDRPLDRLAVLDIRD